MTVADATAGLKGRTVLVTGGAGFIGSHLATELASVADVRVLDHLSAGSREAVPDGVDLLVEDVRDADAVAEAMADVDCVFHLAAQVSVERSIREPVATDETNVGGTLTVLEAARRRDARVVVASSAAVYGEPETLPVSEDHPTVPTNPYGVSKLAVDRYAQVYADVYDLPTVALRYFNVYGPGGGGGGYAGVIDAFLEQARGGGPITVEGDGEQTRDFVHVRDVVRANCRAATTDAVGRAFNVGTGDRVTIRELAERVRETVDADVPIEHVAPREGDVRHSCADVAAAREHLGFDPQVGLTEGLETLTVPAAAGR